MDKTLVAYFYSPWCTLTVYISRRVTQLLVSKHHKDEIIIVEKRVNNIQCISKYNSLDN